jgi:prepilin-type N-terminal cleavage/methylation domain-containing protein
MPRTRSSRPGFTLLELLVAMTLLLLVMAISTQTFRRSSTLLAAQAGRLEAQQNGRFAVVTLDRELRVAGVGVVDVQPILVQASNTAITFNVDLVSRLQNDLAAVYVDTSADSNAVNVLRSTSKVTLPGMTVNYPDTTYMQSPGVPSAAETISYYLAKDSTSSNAKEYILWRRANATTPRVVSRGIIVGPTDTVFQYFKADTLGRLTAVPMASLPLYHKAAIHGSPADTGRYAIVDSITMVRVRFNTVYHDPHLGDITRNIQTTIRLLNAGLVHNTTCGTPPLGVTVSATTSALGAPSPFVTLSWSHSVDDGGGEKDVERYALYRRPDSVATFDQPFASIPAGSSSYTFTDTNVQSGDRWVYGVAAVDCTPSASPIGLTGTVIVP